MWMVWTGGNDRFWDGIIVDQLRHVRPAEDALLAPGQLQGSAATTAGTISAWSTSPASTKPTGPDPERFGLWLDQRARRLPARSRSRTSRSIRASQIGARGKNRAGRLLLRRRHRRSSACGCSRTRTSTRRPRRTWDPERYYTDPTTTTRKDLVRPYRVGMSCGFCHVGPEPDEPAGRSREPEVGEPELDRRRPVLLDRPHLRLGGRRRATSCTSCSTPRGPARSTPRWSRPTTSTIPRTMNAIYKLGPRLERRASAGARRRSRAASSTTSSSTTSSSRRAAHASSSRSRTPCWTPRVLKDGADSVGALGALNRVYLNIGLFSEEWLLHFNPLVGGKPISPIEIAVAQKNSAYWQATEAQTPAMALFFLRHGRPDRLADAPGGAAYLTRGRGRARARQDRVRRALRPLPFEQGAGAGRRRRPGRLRRPNYLQCWNRLLGVDQDRRVQGSRCGRSSWPPDFLDGNYLSTELRVPVTLLQTNACSPLATNAIAGNIWDNFSSQTYKDLPSVGTITVHHPFTGEPRDYQMPAGGRGYTRPPSLVSLWSTAPFLLNNTVGHVRPEPRRSRRGCGRSRTRSSRCSGRRSASKDPVLGRQGAGHHRPHDGAQLSEHPGAASSPSCCGRCSARSTRRCPGSSTSDGDIEIGPIPAGTPVNLLANLDLSPTGRELGDRVAHDAKLLELLRELDARPASQVRETASDEEARQAFARARRPAARAQQVPGLRGQPRPLFRHDASRRSRA